MSSTHPSPEGYNEIENKQAMLAAIIDSSEDAIISKTLEGVITSWNLGAEQLFGYREEEVIGKHISLLIPHDRLSEEDMIIENIRNGRRVQHFQTIRLTKTGKSLHISLTVSPIKNSKGEIIGASKIARDISEQKRLEQEAKQNMQQLEKLYEEIKQLNARKDEFIGIAGHELRTPVTTIKGYLQLLSSEITEGLTVDFTSKALKQVNKLNRLIGDLLDVTKIQSGKLEYNFTLLSILPVIQESIETVRQIHPTHIIEMQMPDEELMVNGDAAKLEQVLINLMANAVKYSPNAAKIDVVVRKENNVLVISVRDYGIGIQEVHLLNIFHRYYRAAPSNTIGGLGIGLYISKEIIVRHGGAIWAESQPNQGSVFYFSLPLTF